MGRLRHDSSSKELSGDSFGRACGLLYGHYFWDVMKRKGEVVVRADWLHCGQTAQIDFGELGPALSPRLAFIYRLHCATELDLVS